MATNLISQSNSSPQFTTEVTPSHPPGFPPVSLMEGPQVVTDIPPPPYPQMLITPDFVDQHFHLLEPLVRNRMRQLNPEAVRT